VFGERAGQAATVAYIAAAVLFLLSIAGFVHAFTSKKADDVILVAEHKEPVPV
jgi:NAD/NADP transhydrogenase beta subunit